MTDNPYHIGDPVMDAAQGRPMIVLDAPDETVAEWSDANNYDLTDNYANAKFGCHEDEAVVECVYVSDVRSEPSKTYTFPASRVRLIDVHHADGGRRVYERVVRGFLAALFVAAHDAGEFGAVYTVAKASAGPALADEALEFAQATGRVPEDV